MAVDYLTVAELAGSLTLTDTFADADLAQAITAASRDVDRRCNRSFSSVVQTRYYTPQDARVVWVDDLRGDQTFTITVDLALRQVFDRTLVAGTDFVLEPLNAVADGAPATSVRLLPYSSAYFPVSERTVRVAGTFGWAAVPAEVKQATGMLATRFMKRLREAPFGVAGFGIDGGAVRVSSFDPDVDALLAGLVRTNHAF